MLGSGYLLSLLITITGICFYVLCKKKRKLYAKITMIFVAGTTDSTVIRLLYKQYFQKQRTWLFCTINACKLKKLSQNEIMTACAYGMLHFVV